MVRLHGVKRGNLPAVDHVARVTAAMDMSNSAVPTDKAVGSFAVATVRGVAVALTSDRAANSSLREWLTIFADEMTGSGLSGRVGTIQAWSPDIDHLLSTGRTYPASFIGYRVTEYTSLTDRSHGWNVTPDITAWIADQHQAFADSLPDVQSWASLIGSSVPIPTAETAAWLKAASPHGSDPKTAYHALTDASAYHKVSLSGQGEFVAQSIVPTEDWQSLLDTKRQTLLAAAGSADVGMIKNIGSQATTWSNVDLRKLHRTVLWPPDYLCNRHLWDEYVIDAAGISLLTDKHLSHANSLEDWIIEEVAPNRFLVSARDLVPWFGGFVPDQEIIERARADFGDMIMSWDAILANPGPYTVTYPEMIGRLAEEPY